MITAYTALVGDIDPPRSDVLCFTDPGPYLDGRWGAKPYKILGHLWVSSGVTLWMDANIFPVAPLEDIVRAFTPESFDVGCFKHPYRSTVGDEVKAVSKRRELEERMLHFEKHNARYLKLPLGECGVLVRRRSDKVHEFNCLWWAMVCRWSVRDQLTFPIAVDRSGVRLHFVDGNVRTSPMFRYVQHQTKTAS